MQQSILEEGTLTYWKLSRVWNGFVDEDVERSQEITVEEAFKSLRTVSERIQQLPYVRRLRILGYLDLLNTAIVKQQEGGNIEQLEELGTTANEA